MDLFAHLPDAALTARLYEIRKEERALLVEFLRYLNELDRRRTVLELGFANLFAFCTEFPGLSNGTAFRRTKSAEGSATAGNARSSALPGIAARRSTGWSFTTSIRSARAARPRWRI